MTLNERFTNCKRDLYVRDSELLNTNQPGLTTLSIQPFLAALVDVHLLVS
jgi:hypothetical protein